MSEKTGTALHPFDADTDVEERGAGRFAATIKERWWVEKGPNGGYVAAIILGAIQKTIGPERAPRSLTVQFPRSPAAGPVEIAVTVERQGGRASFLSARMEQQGELQATALAVLAEDWGLDAPLATAILDAWFPAPFVKIERAVPAPTIDYTVHFRSPLPLPEAAAEDPYLAVFKSGLARHGFFEEDGELWSSDGTLLAQSRQLALLLDRPESA